MKVVIFSGGRGSTSLIKSLKKFKYKFFFKVIVNTYDDGKSSGKLRFLFNMPGPSDMRKIHEIFINKRDKFVQKIYKKRISCEYLYFQKKLKEFCYTNSNKLFDIKITNVEKRILIKKFINVFLKKTKDSELSIEDFSITNIIYAGAYFFYNKNLNLTLRKIEKLFNLKVEVISCGKKNLFLSGINQSNKIFFNESQIVEQRSNINMKEIYLTQKPLHKYHLHQLTNNQIIQFIKKNMTFDQISSDAKIALQESDLIFYSSGTPYSSLYPSYFTKGVSSAIKNNKKAIKILITNIGSDYETPDFKAEDYLMKSIEYLNFHSKYAVEDLINNVIINKPLQKKPYHVDHFMNLSKYQNLNFHLYELEHTYKSGIHSVTKLQRILSKILF